ncbi:helix-turn-helix domain-containing protein [Nocardia sp. CA-129566]|uniref:helix-turn-helix domain-containing protein n=1 Tax=Nocardia sp. CA-129566 TaxID=3239976 RepID=UPI003D9727C5
MTNDDDDPEDTSSTLPRRQLGRLLRDARTAAGLSLESSARLMDWGKATLSRLENGKTEKVRPRDLQALAELYVVSADDLEAWKELAAQAPVRSWLRTYSDVLATKFNTYVELESAASELVNFQPLIFPGLLQTHAYADTMNRSAEPRISDEDLDRLAAVRTRRQHLITRARHPTRLLSVIHENVTRTVVGGPELMADQLRHVADLSARENVDVRLLPCHAGFPTGRVIAPFIVLTFPKDSQGKPVEPSVVYAENFAGDTVLEKRDDVQRFRNAFRTLLGATLDGGLTRIRLREIARSYDSEH